MSSQFKFKIGQRVLWTNSYLEKSIPVRIVERTIEPALHKTYLIRKQNGKLAGYVREEQLSEIGDRWEQQDK